MKLMGRTINPGNVEGETVVIRTPFSFDGYLDPLTGKIPFKGHELEGKNLAGKILVFPRDTGSASGTSYAWQAKENGNLPKALICLEADMIIAVAAIACGIPMIDRLEKNPLEVIKTGDWVKVDATNGIVEVSEK